MTDAPERIWATSYYNQNRSGHVNEWSTSGFDDKQQYEYIRADIARPMTVAEAAKVLLTPDEKGNRNTVYDACEKRVKVYRFDAVLRALSQGGE